MREVIFVQPEKKNLTSLLEGVWKGKKSAKQLAKVSCWVYTAKAISSLTYNTRHKEDRSQKPHKNRTINYSFAAPVYTNDVLFTLINTHTTVHAHSAR